MNTNEGSLKKSLIAIGIPIMLQYMLTSSISLISSIMVGNLGDKAVAALGIGNQIFFIYSLVVLGLFSGAGVLMSQLFGAGDIVNIRRTTVISTSIGILAGAAFLIIEKTSVDAIAAFFTGDAEVIAMTREYMDAIIYSYLLMPVFLGFSTAFRSTKRAVRPMVISAISIFVNIVFNYGLIYGNLGMPDLGIAGAGLSALIARIVEMSLILIISYFSDLGVRLSDIKSLDAALARIVMKASVPVIVNELCWGLGMVIYNIFYGYIGLEALSSIQINSVLQNFFLTLVFGASGAAAIIIGNSVGSGRIDEAFDYSKAILKVSMPLSIITGIAMIIAARMILPLYDVSEATIQNVLNISIIAGIEMPIRFFAVLMLTGILRGGGDAKYTMLVELATMWLIGVPAAFVAVYFLKLPVHVAFAAVLIEDVVKSIIVYRRYASRGWITNFARSLECEAEA